MLQGFIIWVLCSIGVGAWAERWGRSGGGWLILALLTSPLFAGIILAIAGNAQAEDVLLDQGILKTCPFCAENIKAAAVVCKHCGREQIADIEVAPAIKDPNPLLYVWIMVAGVGVFVLYRTFA